MKSFIFLLMLLFLISFVNASGLVINQTNFNVNKTSEEVISFSLVITNSESFTFQNINFETNPYIRMESFSLNSGENKTFIAEVFGNSDFEGSVRIRSFYNSSLTPLNENHIVNIDFNNGLDVCDFSIVKGDSVTWRNNIDSGSGTVKLINANTNQEIASIPSLSNYTEIFNSPLILRYFGTRLGFQFTEVCTITVLDTSGLINNPELDAVINLNLDIFFQPTSISLITLETSYIINPGSSTQDILKITNTGQNAARNIVLFGDWFSFGNNNFDLSPGQSRNIGYTISPVITKTNETNQTYLKDINIVGNFDTIIQPFNIFIPYTNLDEDNRSTLSLVDLARRNADFMIAFCNDFPTSEICENLFSSDFSIFGNFNNDSSGFVSKQEFRDYSRGFIDFSDRTDTGINNLKAQMVEFLEKYTGLEGRVENISMTVQQIDERGEDAFNNTMMISLIVVGMVLLLIIGWIVYNKKNQNFIEETSQYK